MSSERFVVSHSRVLRDSVHRCAAIADKLKVEVSSDLPCIPRWMISITAAEASASASLCAAAAAVDGSSSSSSNSIFDFSTQAHREACRSRAKIQHRSAQLCPPPASMVMGWVGSAEQAVGTPPPPPPPLLLVHRHWYLLRASPSLSLVTEPNN